VSGFIKAEDKAAFFYADKCLPNTLKPLMLEHNYERNAVDTP